MKLLILIFVIICNFCNAQIPAGYYNAAQGLTGNSLKIALHNIILNHTILSYNALWNAYKKTDIKINGKVCDIYSDVPEGTPPYEFIFDTDKCGSYSNEGDCYNREHSWPQSWFNSVSGPVSDLFQVYPTDGKVNGMRGNYPYGNVGLVSWTSLNGSKLGTSSDAGYSNTVFEPIDEFKGDLARTYFYMSTRYYSEDAGWSSSGATNKSEILPWEVNVLLQWHHQDPVSAMEIARNDSIYYLFQHNRNPYIDNPQWADSIWHTTNLSLINKMQSVSLISIFPNPADDFIFIENKDNSSPVTYQIINSIGQSVMSGILENSRIDISQLNKGMYFIYIKTNKENFQNKFIKN